MTIGTLMLIVAGVAIALALLMKLSLINAWFWYGFFVTLFVVATFMSLVAIQAWVLARVIQRVEVRFRERLRRGGKLASLMTLLGTILIPALVAIVSGAGTYLIVTRLLARIVGSAS